MKKVTIKAQAIDGKSLMQVTGKLFEIEGVRFVVHPFICGAHAAQFEYHAAKAFFASAWADQCEENEQASIISGEEIFDVMPDEIDPAALHAGMTLRMGIEAQNAQSVGQLMQYIERNASGDRDATIESFGHYAAMQAMGHGVGLNDALGDCAEFIAVPYVEFGSHSLEKDYF